MNLLGGIHLLLNGAGATYRVVGAELEGVRRKNGDSEEPQEHKAAYGRVLNMWVTCREREHGNN